MLRDGSRTGKPIPSIGGAAIGLQLHVGQSTADALSTPNAGLCARPQGCCEALASGCSVIIAQATPEQPPAKLFETLPPISRK
jgi:hypothetical protein